MKRPVRNSVVNHLVKEGYAELKAMPGTHSQKQIYLTEKGEAFCNVNIKPVFRAEQEAFEEPERE